MRHPLLVPDLRELIHDGEVAGLRDFFAEHHPGRVAELIEDLEDGGRRRPVPHPAAAQPGRGPQLPRQRPPGPSSSRRCRPRRPPNCST